MANQLFLTFVAIASLIPVLSQFRSLYKSSKELNNEQYVSFTVALKLRNVVRLKKQFLAVSDPKSSVYGIYQTLEQVNDQFGASPEDRLKVISYLKRIPFSLVDASAHNFVNVKASLLNVERFFDTKLSLVKHVSHLSSPGVIRADELIVFPPDIAPLVAFTSLNSPVHMKPLRANELEPQISDSVTASQSVYNVSASGGNNDVIIGFKAVCSDGELNNMNPPCSNTSGVPLPTFSSSVMSYSVAGEPTLNQPLQFDISYGSVYCAYPKNLLPCNGNQTLGGAGCTCYAKLSPLPKYYQLRATVHSKLGNRTLTLGQTALFTLTDTATAAFLSDLYKIPPGLQVSHGANQSVVEFYGQFYSNSDLAAFLSLSGLPTASIPESQVFGDLPDDQSNPRGEAQLDVEYIMALAPNATTYFYSFSDLNPYNTLNEGFLAYLTYVTNQTNPSLVQSLSYGDVEADIYNTSSSAAYSYAVSCDELFMTLGLRGITLVFSSGDDGIGNSIIKDGIDTACSQAWPAWPASSPYVTTIGGTQLTNNYLPVCQTNYASAYPGIPTADQKIFECTGAKETVCSSTIGGLITSGGGFSNVFDRATDAPWQVSVVEKYLALNQSLPPPGYFNSTGRAYPDVSTYASNYFVYLGGQITRESGTSASAPVFAAMVTLWNDMRAAQNQPPLGFIAPLLYSIYAEHPYAFNDITTGNNACGVGSSIETVNCCQYSFAAAPGWDAVTGLGSPNFEILTNLIVVPAAASTVIVKNTTLVEYTTIVNNSAVVDNSNNSYIKPIALAAVVMSALSLIVLLAAGLVFIVYWKTIFGKDEIHESSENLLHTRGA